jgi:hypothetical protein
MRVLPASVGPARSPPSWQRPSPTYDHPPGAHFGGDGFGGGADHVVFVRTDNMARRIDHSRVTRHRQKIIIVVNLSRCATGCRAIRALLSLRMATLRI